MNKIVLVEFYQGKPFQVWTQDGKGYDMWDFEWSRRSRNFCYHMSGGGEIYLNHATSKFYAVAGVTPKRYRNGKELTSRQSRTMPEKRIAKMPKRYPLDTLFSSALEGTTVWCSTCQSYIWVEDLCRHVVWCSDCGDWTAPSERCEHTRTRQQREEQG